METGYSNNKDNRGLEEARVKRLKEAEDRVKKQHITSDLAVKKGFLFSTNTTINMKTLVMKSKENKIKQIESEISQIERQKDMKNREIESVRHESETLRREIDQLTKDKSKLESDVRTLEMQSR